MCVATAVCCVGRVDFVVVRSCADVHGDYRHKGESLERGCRRIVTAVLLLYSACCILLSWLLG